MPGKPVKIGPFVGGLNNRSLAGESKDNEVVELINMEVALDTSLQSRPPIEVVSGTPSNQPNQWEVLGIYRITAASWYAVVQVPTGATTFDIRAYPNADFTAAPLAIKTVTGIDNKVIAFVQYNDWCYFNVNTGATDTGFRWKSGSAVGPIAAMPRGSVMVSWKDRLWVTGDGTAATGNYFWFSTVDGGGPKPDTWNTSVDFVNVDPGYGGLNTAMLPMVSTILIFKSDATYRFSFSSSPKSGELVKLSGAIGAAGPNSVVNYENYAFIYDQGRVYELINQSFEQLNINVQFLADAAGADAQAPGVDLSVINKRLVVRYFNTIYSYYVDTRTWSQWRVFAGTPGKFIELPADSNSSTASSFLAPSRGTQQLVGENRLIDPDFVDLELNSKRLAGKTTYASISNSKLTITKSDATFPEIFLSSDGQVTGYDIPVAPNQKFTFTGTVSSTDVETNKFTINYNFLLRSGSTSTISQQALASDLPNLSDEITVPAEAILMCISIKPASTAPVGVVVTIENPNVVMSNTASMVSILRLTEDYQNTPAREYIECWMKTKAYDYQANSVFKRLFLWGLDLKTPRTIHMFAYPLGRKQSVTWDELENYTWDELEAGTFDNPLSWLNVSSTIADSTSDNIDISENGRFFVKAPKSLRFRQIQYAVKLSTLGNAETGPAKVFSLTTYTKAGQMVVDNVT